ncbi:MAG TPA: T9SS type A sorting domain-containing protein [Ignavibacteriaceae bacterium]|nr:T9SS type A sorting domain-containing protein [Ignavibacteriaceae bacterium]
MNKHCKIFYLFFIIVLSSSVNSQNFWQGVPGPDGSVQHYAKNSSEEIFICGGCGFLKSTDDGETWVGASPPTLYNEISITINSSDDVFTGTNGDGIYSSTDNGNTWTQINNGLTNLYVYSLAAHQNDDIYAGLYLDVCKSTDNGNTWSPTNLNAMFITAMDININGIIFAAANTLGVYKSTDNGATWSICNNGLTTAYFFTLRIGPGDDIYLGTVNGGAFRSTDEGGSWIQIGLTGYQVQCFTFAPVGEIFAGTNNGVFKSTDNGSTWTHLDNDGLNNPYIWCLFFNSAGYLFAGTGIGLSRSVEPIITSIDDRLFENPLHFSLNQNYPNPFNPSTSIQYQVPSITPVTLKIYDILGNEVATLVNEEKPAGIYEVEFNPASGIRNLPAGRQGLVSGVYFCRLQTENYFKTIKMLYIK